MGGNRQRNEIAGKLHGFQRETLDELVSKMKWELNSMILIPQDVLLQSLELVGQDKEALTTTMRSGKAWD